jgi:hypothetical protein
MTRVRPKSAVFLILLCVSTLGWGVPTAAAAVTLTLTISPSTISFADASPTTTPTITANSTVAVHVVVAGASASNTWSVYGLANGDLTAGSHVVAISNVTWTSAKTSGSCNVNCTCIAGTASKISAQSMISGRGDTALSGVSCTNTYRLTNSWSYFPGSYSQTMTITITAP